LPRPGEINGQHYFFVSDAEFDALIDCDGLLEWATYQSSRYGTPRAAVEEKIAQGRAVVMELEVQGARQVTATLDPVQTVFLAPPSWDELERRLRSRATESDQVISRRLETARIEMEYADQCDYVIVNKEVADSLVELVNFIGLGTDGLSDNQGEKDSYT